ncbi:hypothetical protein GCM10010329_12800 [Streptomyces spiroverticillatus]|uniref:Uncharacterized protein n=1 Tax=Streptomyces finlayi TaxID=67296 RepID=A0A918WX61_9ACTN|nr:hypothetical protein [Streptomyces finlayi]GGZ93294.1 hypothetical protein GCM10010329_12800 [Streptomyces spiroverticillatus]GHC92418.1 hypothetical protein GCM10010334_28300 [Streptomyces finlayi]
MGWTVLYIAFGVVALWLLGEVLLQYKARLRWRVLAFAGFAVVVVGVLLPSVVVIGAGAIAFAVGQTYVTLSFRRGFSTGWAIGGSPGASKRRRGNAEAPAQQPTLQVSGLEYGEQGGQGAGFDGVPGYDQGHGAAHQGDPQTPVYEPQPMPDETGRYGIYDASSPYPAPSAAPQPQGHDDFGSGSYPRYDPQGGHSHASADTGAYAYDTGQQQYAAYSDPYIGTQSYGGTEYDSYGGQQQMYPGPYDNYPGETPPGGVWVPQQRDGEQPLGPETPQQPAGYPNGYDTGANGQYRY